MSKSQRRVASQLSNDILQGLRGRVEEYTGQQVAEPIPELQNILQGFANINPDDLGGAWEALAPALSGKPSFELSPQITQNYFEQGVKTPLLRTYDTEIAPRIKTAFAGQGAAFSSRAGDAQRRALEDLNTRLIAELSLRQREDQYLAASLAESAATRQQGAASQAVELGNQAIQRRLALQQGLNQFQTLKQAELDSQYAEFLRTRYESSPWIQHALNFLGQNQTYIQQRPSTLQQISGVTSTVGSGLGLALLTGGLFGVGPLRT